MPGRSDGWHRDPRRTAESTPITLCRSQTASGGWEWWLEIAAVRAGGSIFTGSEASAARVLGQLFERVCATAR